MTMHTYPATVNICTMHEIKFREVFFQVNVLPFQSLNVSGNDIPEKSLIYRKKYKRGINNSKKKAATFSKSSTIRLLFHKQNILQSGVDYRGTFSFQK